MSQTVMITGASRGIGRTIALYFARAGYDLVLTCRTKIQELTDYAVFLEQEYHIQCSAHQADMGNWEDVCRVFQTMPHLDVLINNAGISYVGLLTDMSPDDWHQLMRTNLDSCFYTSKLAIPLFLQTHQGRILNISSVWGNVGASMEVAYSASKGAVNSFTKALAKELAPSNIAVNAIACGIIDTEMNNHLSLEEKEAICAEIPADRMGTCEEVAQLVLQTVQAPSYLTGQIITIDGGWC